MANAEASWIVKIHSSSVSPHLVAAPVLLYAGLEGSLCLSYIYIATTARYLVHNSRLLLQWVLVLDFVSCPWRVDADWKALWMLYLLHTRLTSSLKSAT